MPKYTFIREDLVGKSKVTFESRCVGLNELLFDFENFLRGCGFTLDGGLQVVKEYGKPSYSDEGTFPYNDFYDDLLTEAEGDSSNYQFENMRNLSFFEEEDKITLCPICKIDNNIMKHNSCYDKNCPKNDNKVSWE